jgi:hypothetical protein
MLDGVINVLEWHDHQSLPDELYAGALERITGALNHTLAGIEETMPERVCQLREAMRACPDSALVRVLTAPELFSRLVNAEVSQTAVLAFIEKSITAERVRYNYCCAPPESTWTALGDFCTGTRYTAPVVAGIPFDFESPYACAPDIPAPPELHPYDASARQVLTVRMKEAVLALNDISSAAEKLVRLFTRVIIFRRDPRNPSCFLSSSSPRYPGRTSLCNLECATLEQSIDGIVHESIHGLLAVGQLQEPFILDHTAVRNIRLYSPWTGKLLPSEALVEACFVWFGLWNFWRLAADSDRFETERSVELAVRAWSGFLCGSLRKRLDSARAFLSEQVLDCIDIMQRKVIASSAGNVHFRDGL